MSGRGRAPERYGPERPYTSGLDIPVSLRYYNQLLVSSGVPRWSVLEANTIQGSYLPHGLSSSSVGHGCARVDSGVLVRV